MGAMVLHEEAIFPVRDLNIRFYQNTNTPEDVGTLIVSDSMAGEREQVVTGISGKKDYTVVRCREDAYVGGTKFLPQAAQRFRDERYPDRAYADQH